MYACAYDRNRLVLVVLQSKGIATAADFDANVADVERFGDDAVSHPHQTASLLVIAESDNPPSAAHRSRIAVVENRIPRLHLAFVSASAAAPMSLTAMRWLVPSRLGFVRTSHPTYESARDWLVAHGKHARKVYDDLHDAVRRQVGTS